MKKLILISTAAMMMTSFCASAKKEKQTKIVVPVRTSISFSLALRMEIYGIASRFFSTAAMMMTSFCASAKKEKQTKIVNPADMEIRREIAATPEKSGGIYYAYPYSTDSLAPVPAGFEPVYISHYGRHGSRWHTSAKLHDNTLKVLQKQYAAGNLIPVCGTR